MNPCERGEQGNMQGIELRRDSDILLSSLLELYTVVGWVAYSREERRGDLEKAIENSSFVVSAWEGDTLGGLSRALSDNVSMSTCRTSLCIPIFSGEASARGLSVNV